MKKLFAIAALVLGVAVAPAQAASTSSKTVKVGTSTSTYVKKDKAYWTRVWYQKQAAKGKRYKKASYKRKSKKRVSSRVRSGSRVVASVNLSTQRMNVYHRGVLKHSWKVSSGKKGYRTPTGTYRVGRMHKRYFSRKYNGAPMPYAMFFRGGYAIHGTGSIKRLGRTASHGCVRLHPNNAAKLFSMVKRYGGTVKVSY